MTDFRQELLANCEVAAPPRPDGDAYVGTRKLPAGIREIWKVANGLITKRRVFRVFGSEPRPDIPSVQQWNSDEWKLDFGAMASNIDFVAEDIFGDQYGYKYEDDGKKEFVKFCCDDGQVLSIQNGINQFIEALIDPTRTGLLDLELLAQAEKRGLRPRPDEHLAFRVPLCVGGEYSLANLTVESVALHLGTLSQLVTQSLGGGGRNSDKQVLLTAVMPALGEGSFLEIVPTELAKQALSVSVPGPELLSDSC